jgi:NAD(P)H-dependent flavin oxidoreductase YrpB (nitropropane dioxygenase family)
MGVAVSSWRLASAVARAGQLGVVSGTALDLVLARRLQDGDPDGAMRRALAAFPVREVAERALADHFVPGGRPAGEPYGPIPRLSLRQNRQVQELLVLGSFVEVWLAKEGHDGCVGINLLEKIQMATPAAVYGAMLAGVDVVLMGAGIPRDLPALLDSLAEHRDVHLPVEVSGATSGSHTVDLSPRDLLGPLPALRRPAFVAIISAEILAIHLARDVETRPDGFVIEGPKAGGHNAPPRGKLTLDDVGQPVFGPRDDASVPKVADVGLPFWLAGTFGSPEALVAARAEGAAGVQVGTLFALSSDSDLLPGLRTELIDSLRAGSLEVRTDPRVSPTGFPFKVAQLPGTLSDPAVEAQRPRLCDLGYLRSPYVRPNGSVGYHCAAEPEHVHVRKGGTVEDTLGRGCLCNSLTANVGLGQVRSDGYVEKPLVTLGEDLDGARRMLERHPDGWTALDALEWLLSEALLPSLTPSTCPPPLPSYAHSPPP